jgi:hypothetical protein
MLPPLLQVDGEEMPPEIKMGLDPQITFTQCDEDGDVLNHIRIQVMQLDLVVMEEPEEETMRRHRKTMLVGMHERHHIPSGWR